MRSASSLSRRGLLLTVIVSPALLGSYFQCVAVSNPSVTTARIDQLEPTMLRVGDVLQVAGSGNGTPPLQFGWDFGDGTLAPGDQAAHVYTSAGNYRVTLTVRDANGNLGRDSSQVTVSPRLMPSVSSIVLGSDAIAGQPIVLAAVPLEADADELTYIWTFSDGQAAAGPRAVVSFPVPGTYFAFVTVTSNLGTIAVEHIAFEVVDEHIGPQPSPPLSMNDQ